MNKSYEFRLDDPVNIEYMKLKIRGILFKVYLFLVVVCFVTALIVYAFWQGTVSGRVTAGVVAGLAIFLFLALLVKLKVKKTMALALKQVEEKAPESVRIDYELSGDGLTARCCERDVKFPWQSVVTLNEESNFIEIVFDPDACIIIPKRIFDNDQEKADWLTHIQSKSGEQAS